jgi:hypothetical protein
VELTSWHSAHHHAVPCRTRSQAELSRRERALRRQRYPGRDQALGNEAERGRYGETRTDSSPLHVSRRRGIVRLITPHHTHKRLMGQTTGRGQMVRGWGGYVHTRVGITERIWTLAWHPASVHRASRRDHVFCRRVGRQPCQGPCRDVCEGSTGTS